MAELPISIPLEEIRTFCQRWKVVEFALFGSVLRNDFTQDSDIDVLLTFQPKAGWSLFDRIDMQDHLERLFGRQVQIVNRLGIEKSTNRTRKEAILSTAQVIHAA